MEIQRIEIKGLFGKSNVDLRIDDNKLIVVSPNGAGKSTVINVFYLFITKQWSRLRDMGFSSAALTISGKRIEISKDDLDYWESISHRPPKPLTIYVDRLKKAGMLENFIKLKTFDESKLAQYTDILRIPSRSIRFFHSDLTKTLPLDSFRNKISEAEESISELVTAQVVYLPTYRRIEKELQSIFPQIDEDLRKYATEREYTPTGRRGSDFVELVSFGMQDIKKDVDLRLGRLRDLARDQFNNLAGSYLTDVIHARADQFNIQDIKGLTDADISEVLKFVDEKSLSRKDKEMLKEQITGLAQSKKLKSSQRYLAHFFVKLLQSGKLIRLEDAGIRRFAELCNEYLQPSKSAVYDDTTFNFSILDEDRNEIEMRFLSSGEKQIISIFSHLLLSQSQQFVVVIDEPELSLSVPWQVRFLPDILATDRCCALLSVTHSPFIFDNALKAHAVDLREAISKG